MTERSEAWWRDLWARLDDAQREKLRRGELFMAGSHAELREDVDGRPSHVETVVNQETSTPLSAPSWLWAEDEDEDEDDERD